MQSRPWHILKRCARLPQYYRFGDVVLGLNQSDTKTELSDLSFCLTMFSTGMGLALFYFGCSEPIYQLEAALADSYSYNDASQQAMLMTYFHFGLHTWAPFVLVGTLVALAHYRHGLPLAMRSGLYPLLRERTFGWMGDLIDIVSAVCGLVGVAVPLALASMQLSAGLNWQNSAFAWTERGNPAGLEWRSPVAILWAVNFLALVCLATPAGSWKMTVFAAVFVVFLTLDVFFMESSFYILDLLQQSIAFYLQKVVQLSQHLDVFERLDEGIDVDGGQQRLSSWFAGFEGAGWASLHGDAAAAQAWAPRLAAGMRGGQWGWSMAVTPVAGIWIARVSKGRSIKQVCVCCGLRAAVAAGFAAPSCPSSNS
jgi:choline/glycine/proline betaine transport protein